MLRLFPAGNALGSFTKRLPSATKLRFCLQCKRNEITVFNPRFSMSALRILDIDFPVKAISQLAQQEKATKYGLASSLHFWPGRRPQVVAWAALASALTPATSTGLAQIQADMVFPGRPKVLDPFGGGGGFALEALRLGCDVTTNDLNPVAHLLQQATVELPHQFGEDLAQQVAHWGELILARARSKLDLIYGPTRAGITPVAFWWCWGMPCLGCGVWIPFLQSRQLLHHRTGFTLLDIDIVRDQIRFGVRRSHSTAQASGNFGPEGAHCLNCNQLLRRRDIQTRAQAGEMTRRLLGVCERRQGVIFGRAAKPGEQAWALALDSKIKDCFSAMPGGLPKEFIQCDRDHVRTGIYGLRQFKDLFLPRQLLVLGTLIRETRTATKQMRQAGLPEKKVQAISLYLALAVSRTTERNSQLCVWQPKVAAISSAMSRFTLSFCPDFAESNILGSGSGSYAVTLARLTNTIKTLAGQLASSSGRVRCTCRDATAAKTGKYDLIMTDPPYYDSIAYGNLADYYQVWLKRVLHGVNPGWDRELGRWRAGRKQELLIDCCRDGGLRQSLARLQRSTQRALRRIRQQLKSDGRLVFVFGCSFVEGWAIIGDAIQQNGFRVRAAWPVQTEGQGRLRTQSSRALSCSIWLSCDTMAKDAKNTVRLSTLLGRFQRRLPKLQKEWRDWKLPATDRNWFFLAQSLQEFTAQPTKSTATDYLTAIQKLI